ncbi:MAG: ABC transporter permease, partial [Opitutus sp.]
MSRPILKILLPAALCALFIGLWHVLHFHVIGEERRFVLPAPHAVLNAFLENAPYLFRAAINTSKGALLGFGLAVLFSFAFSVLLSLSPLVRAALYPYLMALQLTPL